jgi:transcriptional regulator with XRE-family HTH domain
MTRSYVQQVTIEEMKEYGEFFKSMRLSIGYSLDQMGKAIGVWYTTLARWEKGIVVPNGDIYEIEQRIRDVVKSAKTKRSDT